MRKKQGKHVIVKKICHVLIRKTKDRNDTLFQSSSTN